MQLINAIFTYRAFIFGAIRREFSSRYRQSAFGALWAFAFPLTTVVVYIAVFSTIMQAKLPGNKDPLAYGVFLCAGFVAWTLFADIVNRSTSMFLDNANLLKKLAFPRICLPIIALGSALINFLILLVVLLTVLALMGRFPSLQIAYLLPVVCIEIFIGLGLGIIFGVLNVFFQDFGHFLTILFQFWFWLTPIVYPVTILPHWVLPLIAWNPMTSIVTVYQQVLLNQPVIDFTNLYIPIIWSVVLCTLAFILFRKNSGGLVDQL